MYIYISTYMYTYKHTYNIHRCVERAVGCRLHTLHRLDIPTHGLILLAKTLRFQAHFLAGMRAGAISKRYRALVQSCRPRGPGGDGGMQRSHA